MSQHYPAATLLSARQTIRNGVAEALHLTTGDLPAAWGMARQYCLSMAEACRVTEAELADHYKRKDTFFPGAAGDGITDDTMAIQARAFNPDRKAVQFTEVDFDGLAEAERISGAHCTVIDPIGDALAMVRPPHLT